MKGTRLHDRASIELADYGVADNRRFYVIDERGLMFNGKRDGRLVQVVARYDAGSERLALEFPDGREVAGSWSAGERVVTSFYGRPVAGAVAVGPWSDALSEFIGRAVRLVACERLSDAVDVHPVTLISQASIAALAASAPQAQRLDYRRFRMLIELDGLDANEEDTWLGRRLAIGSSIIEIVSLTRRCIVTSQDPITGERDFDTLNAIRSYADRRMNAAGTMTATAPATGPDSREVIIGANCAVAQAGRVSIGDRVLLN